MRNTLSCFPEIALQQMGFPHYGLPIDNVESVSKQLEGWLKSNHPTLKYDFVLVTFDISQKALATKGYIFKNANIEDGMLCEMRFDTKKTIGVGVYICTNDLYTVLVLGKTPRTPNLGSM